MVQASEKTPEDSVEIAWQPQPGPQTLLITCPFNEILYGGARGGGKTDGLLGDFASHAAQNDGKARGILFRQSFPELADIIERSKKIYFKLGWKYNEGKKTWTDTKGSTLRLRRLRKRKPREVSSPACGQ